MVLRRDELGSRAPRHGCATLGRAVRGAGVHDDPLSDLGLIGVWEWTVPRSQLPTESLPRIVRRKNHRGQELGGAGVRLPVLQVALRWPAAFAHIESFIMAAVRPFEPPAALREMAEPS
jgi:hypothetical protein